MALVSDQTFEGEYDESVFERLKMLAMEKLPGTHETDSELLARAKSFKSQLIKTEKNPILCITHSGMVNALRSNYVTEDGRLD